MDNKKDIGRVFKEELGDLKKSPNRIVWNDIESELDKSEDSKGFYWLRLSSIAALFIGLATIGFYTFSDISNNNNPQNIESITSYEEEETCDEVRTGNQKTITSTSNKTSNFGKETKDTSKFNTTKSTAYKTQENSSTNYKLTTNSNSKKDKKTKDTSKLNTAKSTAYKTQENSSTNYKLTTNGNSKKDKETKNTSKFNIAKSTAYKTQENSSTNYKLANNITSKKDKKTAITNSNPAQGIADRASKIKNEDIKNKTVETFGYQKPLDTTMSNRLKQIVVSDSLEKIKNDTVSAIATNKKEKTLKKHSKDSLITLSPVKNTMFDGLNLGVHVIPTYTIPRDGSLISNRLSNNGESSAFTMNYGVVLTAYANDRVSVRAGYNNIKISSKIDSITSETLTSTLLDASILIPNTIVQSITNQETVNLTQEVQYHELSAALGYKIIDKRFDWSIFGGVSLLVLQKDKITLHSGATNFNLGMNANLESTNTSLNFGSNLRYRLFKNIYFKVEPIINYHLSNASKNQGSYKPLYLSIQSGLSIDF